jgi:hypothetical protein
MTDYKAALYEIEKGKSPEERQQIEQMLIEGGFIKKPYETRRNELRQIFGEYLSRKRRRKTWPKDGGESRATA